MPLLFWIDVFALLVSAVVASSMILVVLGSAPRRALNHALALFALANAGWVFSGLILRLTIWLETVEAPQLGWGRPEFWLEAAVLFLGLTAVLSLVFASLYLDRETRWTRLAVKLALPLLLGFIIPLFGHALVSNPRLTAQGTLTEEISPAGWLAASILVGYLGWAVVLFWQERRRIWSRHIAMSLLILTAGLVLRRAPALPFPVMSLTNTLSTVILAYGVVRRQLVNPLLEQTAALQREMAEREQAEVARRESEQRFRVLFDIAPLGLGIIAADGKPMQMNRALQEMLGYDWEELRAMSFVDYAHPADLEAALYLMEAMLAGRTDYGTLAHRSIRKDGRTLLGRVMVSAVRRPQGALQYFIVVVEDITEREALLAQIQEQAEQLQQTMETVPEGVLLLDARGRVILANPVAAGYLEALAGVGVGDLLPGLGSSSLEALLAPPPRAGLWHEVKVGKQVLEIVARPVGDGDEARGWVMVLRDVTQERMIQRRVQQRERLAAVGQLAAGIAHDFNNIMAVIILYSQLTLRQADLPAEARHRLATVTEQAKRATELIQQILDFGRKSVLERRPVDLVPFLREQVKLLERTLPENIKVKMSHGEELYMVSADLTRIQQVVMNLAVNARDAMPGGGELLIKLERAGSGEGLGSSLDRPGPGDWLRIQVSDTGSGILPEHLPRLFDPFFTTKAAGQGSGLGLAQVHGIIKQHEGEVEVESQLGKGSTFSIFLPALPVQETAAGEGAVPSLIRGRGETLLLVEDNPATRLALKESLELLNYRVLEAANGREALAMLDENLASIALILSDLVMPEMGGDALFQTWKERALAVPLVMMTGHPMEKELETMRAEGLSDWLGKPVELHTLSELVARFVGGGG